MLCKARSSERRIDKTIDVQLAANFCSLLSYRRDNCKTKIVKKISKYTQSNKGYIICQKVRRNGFKISAISILTKDSIIITPSTKVGYYEQQTSRAARISFLMYLIGILQNPNLTFSFTPLTKHLQSVRIQNGLLSYRNQLLS